MSTTTSSDRGVTGAVLYSVQYARKATECEDSLVVALHPDVSAELKDGTSLDSDDPIVSIFGIPVVVTERVPDVRVIDFGRQSEDL